VTAPREVLDAHTTLYERLKYPPRPVVDFYRSFFSERALRSMESNDNGDRDLLARWLQMFAPSHNESDFLDMVRRSLYGAPTYQVSADIVTAVTATYEATAHQTVNLNAGDVPSLTGFAWLDSPIVLTDAGGYSIATRALSWGPQHIPEDFLEGDWPPPETGSGRDGVRLTSYAHVDDADSTTVPEMADRLRSMGMPLSISHSAFVPFDYPLGRRRIEADDVTADDITRWAHTLWMFMGTEIVATAQPQVERPSRRRAQRVLSTASVNVVTLRRIRHGGVEVDHRDIDWSCRWIVQQHYRHLEDYAGAHPLGAVPLDGDKDHCAVCGRRITRVRAYVKGPDGLPLKPVPETVYRVVR
jgi:hypothetical protein